ncbi:MAG: BolA family protein [Methylophilus sp.]|nr:BolA family protein [Methylophilus sp.]
MSIDIEIAKRLRQLEPVELQLTDLSALHAGHQGHNGGGHFQLKIVSSHFSGKSQIMRHRMIYQTLNDLIPQQIHALSIVAISPDDPS